MCVSARLHVFRRHFSSLTITGHQCTKRGEMLTCATIAACHRSLVVGAAAVATIAAVVDDNWLGGLLLLAQQLATLLGAWASAPAITSNCSVCIASCRQPGQLVDDDRPLLLLSAILSRCHCAVVYLE